MKLKYFSLALAVLLIAVATSCKKDTVDVTALLKTVPASAAGVIVIDVENLAEDLDSKIKDHKIIPGKQMQQILDQTDKEDQEELMKVLNGDSGIEPNAAVIFFDSNRTFLTYPLYDVDKYCAFVEKEAGETFTQESNGVKVCGSTAVKGAQAWICLTSDKQIDLDAIASYASLNESQSFLVTPMGEYLLTHGDEIRGWALIDTFVSNVLTPQDKSFLSLGLGFLFENAESVKFSAEFDKGEFKSEAVLLNDQFKPAKYQLPIDKVDVKTLKSLGSTCDVMMAFTINPKLVKKLEQIATVFGGAIFGTVGKIFENIDGTVGLIGSGSGMGQSLNGVVTLKGEPSQQLKDIVSDNLGPVSIDGKLLRFNSGDVKGTLSVSECAEQLKDCSLGFVVDTAGINSLSYGQEVPSGFKYIVFKLEPESGGIEFKIEAKTTDPKENALLSLLQSSLNFSFN